MHPDRTAAAALAAGSLAGLVTMALHPTGQDVVGNASAGRANTLAVAAHLLAVLAQPLVLAGTLALTVRLRARVDLAVGACVFFAVASVAAIVAAAASGLVAPAVVRRLAGADDAARATMLDALRYTGLVNQAFARIDVLLGGCAILLWSAAILAGRELPRGVAVYGLLLGAAQLVAVLGGRLRLDVHGFGAVVLGQGVWMTWVAALLWRSARG